MMVQWRHFENPSSLTEFFLSVFEIAYLYHHAAQLYKNQSLSNMMNEVVKAAEAGLEKTKHMVATTGKAKTLGERSLGFPDPGAISMTMMLKSLRQFAQ